MDLDRNVNAAHISTINEIVSIVPQIYDHTNPEAVRLASEMMRKLTGLRSALFTEGVIGKRLEKAG
ncbi:MAG: hypothetical protein ACM3X4_01555 [Ignavibacteriales bacterium]